MKLPIYLATAALAAGLIAGAAGSASAQSDRTFTIQCNVAGHDHCGARSGRLHREYRPRMHYGWRAFGAAHCREIIRHEWRYGHRVTVRRSVCR